jgi:hypothetical protein
MRAFRLARTTLTLAAALICLSAGAATAQYSFDWDLPQQGAVRDLLILEDFMTTLTNTSAVTDSFKVTMVKDMPLSWQATICQGPVCYPPSVTVHTFILGPGESTNLDFAVTGALDEGTGVSTATVESLSNPAVTATNSFTLITTGLDILIVDADGGAGYESFFDDAVGSTGRTLATWNRDVMGLLTGDDMSSFDAVVWFVGTNSMGLTGTDRANLEDYLQGGGNLFLTGQNLARDFCWSGSGSYTPESHAWFRDLLGIDFVSDNASTSLVTGVSDDPVSDGMVLAIDGGDGAGNNSSPDEIVSLANGATSFNYYTGSVAATRGAYGGGRTFFAAFGFEGLSSASQRNDMMASVLDWIIARFSPVENDVRGPLVGRAFVTPNPFNPQTSLKFEVGGDQAVSSEVVIFDLRGRSIRSLFRGQLSPGPQTMVWNGRDDRGRSLGSGIYLVRVKVGQETRTVKMTLAR